MLKYFFSLILIVSLLDAKSSVGACIPIGKVVTLKKSIMTLKLSKKQKERLYTYEEKLKDDLNDIKDGTKKRKEGLSCLFDKDKFLQNKFTIITTRENVAITSAISEYLTHMYATLTKEQKVKLIKRFKRIERKRNKSHSKD